MNEDEAIAAILSQLSRSTSEGIVVDAGDDAAVLRPVAGALEVLSVDAQVEGVHFRRSMLSLEDIGFRAIMAAASDLAAMGAHARAALVAVAAPAGTAGDIPTIMRGALEAADVLKLAIVGGNLTRATELSVTTTVLGTVHGAPLRRAGARPGDRVYVTGWVGFAALGCLAASRAYAGEDSSDAIARWRKPIARLSEGLRLRELCTACIDVSDGLAKDADRLARASAIAIHLDVASLPLHRDHLALARSLGTDPIAAALAGGEDYELLVTGPASESIKRLATHIGEVVEGEPGVIVIGEGGVAVTPPPGFDHFST